MKPALFLDSVVAGFTSPASDFIEKKLDLNSFLIQNPEASFFVRVSGDSMKNAGIFSNDILLVDKSLDPKNNDIIVAFLNGEFTVKRLSKKGTIISLVPENSNYRTIRINSGDDFRVWGVVSSIIRKL
ncbi:MAG TPA: translesion error-prone DNA polymerase V autoproteolytic subunit [Candidatus Dojkabacteria bacterium]|jgi:DNA polymerase V